MTDAKPEEACNYCTVSLEDFFHVERDQHGTYCSYRCRGYAENRRMAEQRAFNVR